MESWKRTLYILTFVQFVSAVGMSSIFSFLPLYVDDLGSTTGLSVELLSGLVFSVQAFTMMIAAPIWGALADRHGRKMMVIRATLGGGVIVLLMGFARSAEDLLVLRALQGFITGVFSALTALVVASVPRDRMGYALGLLQVGLWGGTSLGPLIGGVTADTLGFQAAFMVTAALLTIAGLLVWWGIDEDFTPLPRQRGPSSFFAAWQHVLSIHGVRITYMARFLSRLGRTIIFPFTPLFVQQLMGETAHTSTVTGVLLAASSVAGTFAAIYLGRIGDRVGYRHILVLTALAAGVLYLPQSLVTSVWQLGLLLTLTGAAAGGIMPMLSALLAGYTEPGEEGAVFGLESSIMAAARAISPLIGAALALWFGLRSVYAAAGLIFLSMALLAHYVLPESEPHPVPAPAPSMDR